MSPSSLDYISNPMKTILLFYNALQTFNWLVVLILALNSLHPVFPSFGHQQMITQTCVAQGVAILELLWLFLGWTKGSFVAAFLQNLGRDIALFLFILTNPNHQV